MSAYLIERRYVIGVTWQQTVQAVNLKKHAQQLARKAKADYYCTVAPATVGTAKLKVSNQGKSSSPWLPAWPPSPMAMCLQPSGSHKASGSAPQSTEHQRLASMRW